MSRSPFVDMAVWHAYGARYSTFKTTDVTVLEGSNFVTKRRVGPSTYPAWLQGWDLFAVSMMCWGAASLGSLDLYAKGIEVLYRLFPDHWSFLIATDIIVRSERWARLKEVYDSTPPCLVRSREALGLRDRRGGLCR